MPTPLTLLVDVPTNRLLNPDGLTGLRTLYLTNGNTYTVSLAFSAVSTVPTISGLSLIIRAQTGGTNLAVSTGYAAGTFSLALTSPALAQSLAGNLSVTLEAILTWVNADSSITAIETVSVVLSAGAGTGALPISYVSSLNGLVSGVSITGAGNVTVVPSGQSLIISGLTSAIPADVVRTTGAQVINGNKTFAGIIDGGSGRPSINLYSGIITNSSGIGSVDWERKLLLGIYGLETVNWTAHTLKDDFYHDSVYWDSRRQLIDINGFVSLDWANKLLSDVNGNVSVNYGQNFLSFGNIASLDWHNKTARDSTNNVTLDWQNKALNGAWTITGPNLKVDAGAGTLSQYDGTFGLNLPSGYIFATSESDVTINYGARALVDNTQIVSFDWQNRYIRDFNSVVVADFGTSLLNDSNLVASVNWTARQLGNSTGGTSLDWNGRQLYSTWNCVAPTSSLNIANKAYVDSVSGALTAVATSYYPRTNPSGYLQSGTAAGLYATVANLAATGATNGASIASNTALISSLTGASGNYYPKTNPSGYLQSGTAARLYATIGNLAATGSANAASIATNGASIAANTALISSLTGASGSYYLNSNPSGYLQSGTAAGLYATIGNLAATGATNGASIAANTILINSLTGATGNYYLNSNPNGYIISSSLVPSPVAPSGIANKSYIDSNSFSMGKAIANNLKFSLY